MAAIILAAALALETPRPIAQAAVSVASAPIRVLRTVRPVRRVLRVATAPIRLIAR